MTQVMNFRRYDCLTASCRKNRRTTKAHCLRLSLRTDAKSRCQNTSNSCRRLFHIVAARSRPCLRMFYLPRMILRQTSLRCSVHFHNSRREISTSNLSFDWDDCVAWRIFSVVSPSSRGTLPLASTSTRTYYPTQSSSSAPILS